MLVYRLIMQILREIEYKLWKIIMVIVSILLMGSLLNYWPVFEISHVSAWMNKFEVFQFS